MRILLAAMTAALPSLACAVPISVNSGVSTIIGGTYESGTVSGAATLNIIDGVIGPGSLQLEDDANLNVLGGHISHIDVSETARVHSVPAGTEPDVQINLFDGHVGRIELFETDARLNIFGGSVSWINDSHYGRAFMNFYGGDIDRLWGQGYATVNFFGYGFGLTCSRFHPFSSSFCIENTLTGFWADGTSFEVSIRGDETTRRFFNCTLDTCNTGDYHTSVRLYTVPSTVPEPGPLALLASALFGVWTLRRRSIQA